MPISTLLVVCLGVTFFLSTLLTRFWITRAKRAGLLGMDMHKQNKCNIAEIGGLPVFVAFLVGIFLYLGVRTFLFRTAEHNAVVLAGILTVSLATFIGLVDDILGWKIGLRQWQKPLLCVAASLPMMMVNAGTSTMNFPILGQINLGWLYPLVLIPLIITTSANAFNMIAGYNGLEAGLGIIMLFALGGIVWLVQGLGIYAMLAAIMIASLLGFLFFNKYPAKVFPGDTLTYMVGSLIAVIVILGNAEKTLLILFIPYIIQFFIKSFHGWQKQSFGEINMNETFKKPKEINAIEHCAIYVIALFKRKVKENEVVFALYAMELVFVAIAVVLV